MQSRLVSLRSLIALGALVGASTGAAHAAGFQITSFTVDGGGGSSTGGGYALTGSIAQHDAAAPLTVGQYALAGGFWTGAPSPPCPGDTDNSGAVDIDDIVNVVLDFGTDGLVNGGDVDGSGLVDIDDVVLVVLNFGACPGQ